MYCCGVYCHDVIILAYGSIQFVQLASLFWLAATANFKFKGFAACFKCTCTIYFLLLKGV